MADPIPGLQSRSKLYRVKLPSRVVRFRQFRASGVLDLRQHVVILFKHRGFLWGIALLVALFLFAYGVPGNAILPERDFLDSILVLNFLYSQSVPILDLEAELPGLIGGLSANALALNDLDPSLLSYRILDPFTAAVTVDSVVRLVGFSATYAIVFYQVREFRMGTWFAAGSGLFLALQPYLPSLAATVCFSAVSALAIMNLILNRYTVSSWILLTISSQAAAFISGGFALMIALLAGTAWCYFKRYPPRHRLLVASGILLLGFSVASIRPIYLLSSGFVSHRTSWPSPTNGWLAPSTWRYALNSFLEVIYQGQFDFYSGQRGLPLVMLLMVLVLLLYGLLRNKRFIPTEARRAGRGLAVVLSAIVAVSLVYALELSTLTQFGTSLIVPIALYRIVVFLPLLWSVSVGLSAGVLTSLVPNGLKTILGPILFVAVAVQGILTHQGISGRVQHEIGMETTSVSEYYAVADYLGLARALGREPIDLKVVSFGLDPMKAAFSNYSVMDGYLYNYPLDYKEAFRRVILPELEDRDPRALAYFDDWGSKLYLYRAGNQVTAFPQFDLCALVDLGVEYVLTPKDVELSGEFSLGIEFGQLRAYRIFPGC